MTGPTVLETRRMTPDDVLRILADSHRQQCQYDPEAEPDAVFSHQMTVDEWCAACDLIGWRRLGRALNREFGISFSAEEWKRVLTPSKKKTLRNVCDLIAAQAVVPIIAPLKMSGKPCVAAGAFFAVRRILQDAGVDASKVRPSTPMCHYLRHPKWLYAFLSGITKIAPGALPPVSMEVSFLGRTAPFAIMAGIVTASLLNYLGYPVVAFRTFLVFFLWWLALWIPGVVRLTRVTFGHLVTFGDLARAIAGRQGSATS